MEENGQNPKYYLESLKKYKHSEIESEKFKIIECQELVDKIQLKDIINIMSLPQLSNSIIIEIGKSETMEREYKISQRLSEIPGFIKYLYCLPLSNNKNLNHIITKNSYIYLKEPMKILVMKEYINIKDFNWNKDNFNILKSVIKQCIASLYLVFQKFRFIHTDLHLGNILLTETNEDKIEYKEIGIIELFGYKIIIMDFENSLFNQDKTNYYFLYKMFRQILNGINYTLYIRINGIERIIDFLQYYEDNYSIQLNILILLSLVDKLEFVEKYNF